MISKENELLLSKNDELLISELCSRLPYGVICECDKIQFKGELREIILTYNMCRLYNVETDTSETCYIYDCKPYLFPMSSMTEEQYDEMYNYCYNAEKEASKFSNGELKIIYTFELFKFDWLNRNHFDWRGLIPMGLAKDATKLKIY